MTFTQDLAAKWGQHNINVNAIAPGFFPTKMSKVLIEQGKDYIMQSTPLGRLGSDSDLQDRKSTRLNSSHVSISYAVFCLNKKCTWMSCNFYVGTRSA